MAVQGADANIRGLSELPDRRLQRVVRKAEATGGQIVLQMRFPLAVNQ